jgi:ribose 5-phosphate isomerase B
MTKVGIGADHRGYELKESIKNNPKFINDVAWVDVGAAEYQVGDHYPDYAARLVEQMKSDPSIGLGILICGSGVGMSVAANKFTGIRSGLGINPEHVVSARHDDDINVLAIASDYTSDEEAAAIIDSFLHTDFSQESRHVERIEKIKTLESQNLKN